MNNITTDTILESISDGVFTIDNQWKITSFNRAAELITGLKRSQVIGLRCHEVFKSNLCEGNCPLEQTFNSKKAVINQNGYIVNLEGERIPISISTALLRDENGEIIGGAETFRDLSEIEQLKKLRAREILDSMASNSVAMQKVLAMVTPVAQSNSTLLILGESGSGKEVLARTIHSNSHQKEGPFVAVNCAALPDTLLESELFGYRKGAFSGADKDKIGRFALAEGGTLFLDEIGDLSLAMQVKLLRVLQEREYEMLGSNKSIKTNARIITATNKEIEKLVAEGKFRQDLYYRINIIAITIPSLRERREDIPLLADQFLQRFSLLNNKAITGFTSEVYGCFYAYDWPGNIRELENVVERAVVLTSANRITTDDLPPEIACFDTKTTATAYSESTIDIEVAKKQIEERLIKEVLEKNSYKIAKAAKELGIHRSTLYRKMEGLEIPIKESQ
ncbi:MAG: sigma 54-interacting transcriptional regulator [Sphaerochaetaceae bacterium]